MTGSGPIADPEHLRRLREEGGRLLGFAKAARHPQGGFAWLDDSGRPDPDRPVLLWVTARMTHVFSLGHLLGDPDSAALADHGLRALRDRFRDVRYDGWYPAVGPEGPVSWEKTAYEHAFVLLAAASAAAAGRPGAEQLLADALGVVLGRFWDAEAGMMVEEWDRTFETLDGYRGVNANMHFVEALLSAADVTGDPSLRRRALRVTGRVVHELARCHEWRIPEHLDAAYRPVLDYNADQPGHPFRPFGATVGHGLEWARLTLQLDAALGDAAPPWLQTDAACLFGAAVRDGWAAEARPDSSTRSTGTVGPSRANACTGWRPRRAWPPRRCTP